MNRLLWTLALGVFALGGLSHRIRQLSVRGMAKTQAEWTFITTVHNLFKAITSGHLTPQALTALPS